MKHEVFIAFGAIDIINHLLIKNSSECRDPQTLGFSAGKQRASMGPGQNIDFTGNRSDVFRPAAVGSDFLFDN